MNRRYLSDEEIQGLNRDLRILVTTNGTLTRILNIVTADEIVIENIDQEILPDAPTPPDPAQLPKGRTLLRNVVLKGRHSGSSFVAAETSIVVDRVPPELIESLMNTDRPIGELLVASRIEFFKEAPEVWIGELPEWIVAPEYGISQHQALARRYTIIISGQPAIVITEHFLPEIFICCLNNDIAINKDIRPITAPRPKQ